MAIKKERFTQWRKEKAGKEEIYFSCAFTISEYLNSIKKLDVIKADFSGVYAPRYLILNRRSERAYGIVLYIKLQIDDALEQITAADLIQRPLLLEISEVLGAIYESPLSDMKTKVHKLLSKCKQFLEINVASVEDKELTKKLMLDFYFFFHMLCLAIAGLTFLEYGLANTAISTHDLNISLQKMGRTTELRMGELDQLLRHPLSTIDLQSIKVTTQEYFNQRYMALLKTHGSEEQIVSNMSDIINLITALLKKREEKEKLIVTINSIKQLMEVLKPDVEKTVSRRGFLRLIKANTELFDIFKSTLNEAQNTLLDAKIAELEKPVAAGMVTSAAKAAYRNLTPQVLQNALSNNGTGLTEGCRKKILEFAKDSLTTLNLQEIKLNKEIDKLTRQLSKNSPELNQLVTYETPASLESLRKTNVLAKKALVEYRQIAKNMSEQVLNLKVIKKAHHMLSEFIHHYDGFWVLVSNLLARISTVFKSDTATLIDNARETNRQLLLWELENRVILTEELQAVELNIALDDDMKSNIQEKVKKDLLTEPEMKSTSLPDKEKVRCLTSNLRGFFSRAPGTNVFEREKKDFTEEPEPRP